MLQVSVAVKEGSLQLESMQGPRRAGHVSAAVGLVQPHLPVASAAAAARPAAVPLELRRAGVVLNQPGSLLPASYAGLASSKHDASGLHISPSVLDSCLQLGAVKHPDSGPGQLFVPAGLGALLLSTPAAPQRGSCAVARPASTVPTGPTTTFTDYSLSFEDSALAVCSISSLEAKPLGGGDARQRAAAAAQERGTSAVQREQWLYQLEWRAQEAGAQALAAAATATEAAAAQGVHLDLRAAPASTTAAGIAVLQGAIASGLQAVTLVTQGVQHAAVGTPAGDGSALPGAGAWALARTLAQELSSFSVQAVDLPAEQQQQARGHATFLAAPVGTSAAPSLLDGSPYGMAVRDGAVLAATLRGNMVQPALPPYHLMPRPRGALQNLQPEPVASSSLAPGQVMVAVRAVGINFRDLLNVLGMYPGDPGPPGGDCAGVVQAAPAGSSLQAGDAVFGLAAGCLGSHVLVSEQTMTQVSRDEVVCRASARAVSDSSHTPASPQMPPNLSFEEAATTPTVFITVDEAFRQAAAVAPGDRVLVHAAAGGVGLAALQLIHALGAQPMATAGSSDKRMLVRSRGVCQVLGSRDTAFAGEAAQLGGVDVVLNSLTSAGMVAGSLAALRRGGRMVEISKRDIWSAARVAQGERRCVVSASLVLGPP